MATDSGATKVLGWPDGRLLTVRRARPSDVDALLALYRGLDAEDRHLRFFTASVPTRHAVERWCTVGERGGVLLVVEVDDPPGALVAEAGCERLPNGDGEYAITVAPAWRGWLGPFLFDAMLRAAAEAGVPNVEGDVLVANGPMLAIARSRGIAMGEPMDVATTRVVLSTTGGVPSWPPEGDRRRVLVEASGGWTGEDRLRQAGYEVLRCPGPRPGRPTACPLLHGRRCPLVDGADAVVLALPTGREPGASLVAVHRCRRDGPACIDLTASGSVDAAVAAVDHEVRSKSGNEEEGQPWPT